jgi:hypothetical protein
MAAGIERGMATDCPDVGMHVAWLLDSPSGFDREKTLRAGLVHTALSLAAMRGAGPIATDLRDLALQIEQGLQSGHFRGGGKLDLN